MKIVCVYHSVDLDGWMSAAIVKFWFNEVCVSDDEITFIGYNYGDNIPNLLKYDVVILCDVSFPNKEMETLLKELDRNFIWIDHHISAIKENKSIDRINGLRDTNYAACELTWKYFFKEKEMPEIVWFLGRYDCFGHKGMEEEQSVLEFQYGARSLWTNYENLYQELVLLLKKKQEHRNEGVLEMGKYIYRYLKTEAEQSYKNNRFEIFFDYPIFSPYNLIQKEYKKVKFVCVNKERFNPINFEIDYHSDGYDGAACFYRTKSGRWAFSLYNDNGKIDCSIIAKKFNGGGHKGASGFICDNRTFLKIMK